MMPLELYFNISPFFGNFVSLLNLSTDKIGKNAKKGAKIVLILRGPFF
jgi:hypothetical protein